MNNKSIEKKYFFPTRKGAIAPIAPPPPMDPPLDFHTSYSYVSSSGGYVWAAVAIQISIQISI